MKSRARHADLLCPRNSGGFGREHAMPSARRCPQFAGPRETLGVALDLGGAEVTANDADHSGRPERSGASADELFQGSVPAAPPRT